ncbi:MAG: 2-amino-4-hydroxy-6-hydroxymethyldihydropteridine diphosphokinase [Victivallales bacterium]|nr:2-amino-4-hydroxy-6-hydroxymethyldihydropteridine diphosphokinase [Victivallales bacterium]
MIKSALSLGANIGDIEANFALAVDGLASAGMCEICRSSLFYSEAVECLPGTPPFTNQALTGLWRGSAHELWECCKGLEIEAGRPPRHLPGTSRTLDIDIIIFGDGVCRDGSLHIPHRKAAGRDFVIFPLAEIAGDWIFPGTYATVGELAEKLARDSA